MCIDWDYIGKSCSQEHMISSYKMPLLYVECDYFLSLLKQWEYIDNNEWEEKYYFQVGFIIVLTFLSFKHYKVIRLKVTK